MRTFTLFAAALVMLLGLCLQAGTAHAQATRTWVSGVGDDANPCSRTAPCKTFAGAISKTSTAGEINCLDPGGFGAVTITKAITISCVAVEGGVLVSGTNGIVVNAAGAVVILQGLDFVGLGTGLNGVLVLNAASVTVQNCRISGFVSINGVNNAGGGIFVQNSSNTELLVVDSVIENNPTGGIWIQPQGSFNALVTINRVQINNNKFGVVADGTVSTGKINGTVRDSTVGNNSQNGITASATTASNSTLEVDNVSIIDNVNNGLSASGTAAGLLVSNSTIYGNGGGIHSVNSGAVASYGNNRLNGNSGNDGAFTSTIGLH